MSTKGGRSHQKEPGNGSDGLRQCRPQARRGLLSREHIVDAALDIVRAGGYEQMTIRSLAAGLGVSPMSLYRHVKDKDDLLLEVVDRLLEESWRPRRPRGDWRRWTLEAAERLRRLLVDQPAALHVYLARPVTTRTAIERMEAMLEVLQAAGLSAREARAAYGTIHTYTIGFAALQASRARQPSDAAPDGRMARLLASYTRPEQFALGLNHLLDGVSVRMGDSTKLASPSRAR